MGRGQRENKLQKSLMSYLSLKGFYVWENKTAATFDRGRWRSFHGLRGVSDILGILCDGRFLAIEVKVIKPDPNRPGKFMKSYPSKDQREFMAEINGRGGLAFVARSVDDLERELHDYL